MMENESDANAEEPSRSRWPSIRKKCHAAMFEMAELWKELIYTLKEAGTAPSERTLSALDSKLVERTIAIHNRHPDLATIDRKSFAAHSIFSESALSSDSPTIGVAEYIHFERHKIPLKYDMERLAKKDWDASHRLQRTLRDTEQLRCDQGPIIPFKGNTEHSNIFSTLWGLGIERLSQEELADFFDKYCPCGVAIHDPNTVWKHRSRFEETFEIPGINPNEENSS